MIAIEKLDRIKGLAFRKLARIENGYQCMDIVWDVMSTYKTIDKLPMYAQYYIFDFLCDWENYEESSYEGEEYMIIDVQGVKYVTDISEKKYVPNTNKEDLSIILRKNDLVIDEYDEDIELIPKEEINRLSKYLMDGSVDVLVRFNNEEYVLSMVQNKNVCSFGLFKKSEYEKMKPSFIEKRYPMITSKFIFDAGREIASMWGADLMDIKVDKEKRTITYYCIEYGERFYSTITFRDLIDDYDNLAEVWKTLR